jgi:GNAT superfamily N-acetyltransferase
MKQIQEISYTEAMRQFEYLYKMEKLPSGPVLGGTWYASDGSCAALVKIGNGKKYRIKGTVTAPELRGEGYGDAMLRHLIAMAVERGAEVVESYAKEPAWYLRNGFEVKRVTKWGVTVVQKSLLGSPNGKQSV